MTSIRCPQCGELNFAQSTVCQFCSSNLPSSSTDELSEIGITQPLRVENLPSPKHAPLFPSRINPLDGINGLTSFAQQTPSIHPNDSLPSRLKVTDAQIEHAELLRNLIDAEGAAPGDPSRRFGRSKHFSRFFFSVILIVGLLIFYFVSIPELDQPEISPAVLQTYKIVENLAVNLPALLVIDYNPAYSAELDLSIKALLTHLARKNILSVFVSSLPTGPFQIEKIFNDAKKSRLVILPDQSLVYNLGYIPGGLTGIPLFIQAPRQIMPSEAWTHGQSIYPELMGINSPDDFSIMVIATENSETARSWIEQIQVHPIGRPLIFVISAQATPALLPYYSAIPKQIDGLLSGIEAGLQYETFDSTSDSDSRTWLMYNLGMLLAGILMAVGGILNAGITWGRHSP